MTGRKGLVAWALGVALCGCSGAATPPMPPGAVGDDGRQSATLAINVRSGAQPVAGASVEFSGAGLGTLPLQQTGPDGAVAFANVSADDAFVIRAEAPGFVPTSRTTADVAMAAGQTVPVTVDLVPATGVLSGRVVTGGLPLAGAIVSDGRHSVETNELGRFQLAVDRTGPVLKVAATGYVPQVVGPIPLPAGKVVGDVSLAPHNRQLHVLVDGSKRPFGTDAGDDRLQALYTLLTHSGCEVTRHGEGTLADLSGIDVLLVPVPTAGYTPEERTRITDYVLEGGKLVVLGEWGGFSGFNLTAANELLLPFNLRFNADSLRAPNHAQGLNDTLAITNTERTTVLTGVQQARFYQAASVQLVVGGTVPLEPRNTRLLTRLAARGMRIASVWGAFSPLATAIAGAGRVVAIGDASAFTADDSDGDGTMNLLSGDNRTLAWNIFRW